MRNIHFKTCTCLLGILLMLFSGIQARGASLEVQQERKISGTVIDEKGEPVIGASVVVVETKQGTITNIDGKFQVNAPQNGRLKISYIGYETQEVAIKDRQLLKIVLKEESTALNEVVQLSDFLIKIRVYLLSTVENVVFFFRFGFCLCCRNLALIGKQLIFAELQKLIHAMGELAHGECIFTFYQVLYVVEISGYCTFQPFDFILLQIILGNRHV